MKGTLTELELTGSVHQLAIGMRKKKNLKIKERSGDGKLRSIRIRVNKELVK